MSPSESRNGHEADSIPEGGILASLPRSRPQRASARRAAARTSTATKRDTPAAKTATATTKTATATKTKSARTATAKKHVARESPAKAKAVTAKKPTAKKLVATKKISSTKRGAAKSSAKPIEQPAPKQGYEPEEELELGKSVNPPSGAELVESVADIIGELANSGLTAGGRLLKDAFSLVRRP